MTFPSDGITFKEDLAAVEAIKAEYWPHIRAKGYFLVVKPYIRPVNVGELMLPESMRFEDQHHSTIAQVIDIGPLAYTDEKICGGISWARIGDWVVIPRVAGTRIGLKRGSEDLVLRIVKEDDVIGAVYDPSEWEIRINQTRY